MGIFSDLFLALARVLGKWKLWLVLWAFNLVVATIAGAPYLMAAMARLGSSLVSRGQPFVSPAVLMAMPSVVGKGGPLLGGPMLLSLLLSFVLAPWLAGGTLAELMSSARFRLSSFLSECGHLGGRYLRLYFFTLPVFLLMVAGVVSSVVVLKKGGHVTVFTSKGPLWFLDDPFTRASLLQLGLTFLLLGFWRAYLDLARGLVLQQQLRQTRRAAWRAFKLVLRSPLLVLCYVLLGTLGWLAVLGMMRVHAMLGVTTVRGVAVAFLVSQLVLVVRMLGSLLPTALVAARLNRAPPFVPPTVVAVTPSRLPPPELGDDEPSFPGVA